MREQLFRREELFENHQHEIAIEAAFHEFNCAFDVDFYEKIHPFKTVSQLAEMRQTRPYGKDVSETMRGVLKQEHIPALRNLIDQKMVSLSSIPTLRMRPEAIEFRRWLWGQPDPQNAPEVIQSYCNIILANPVDHKIHRYMQMARITSVSLLGSAVGAGIGSVIAGVAGTALGAFTGLAISLADGFSDDMLRKDNPRHFSAVLRDELIKNQLLESKN